MAMRKGDEARISQSGGARNQMPFRNPHIDDSIWKLLLEDFSHLAWWKVGITRNNPFILPCQFNQGPVMSRIHILIGFPFFT